MRSFRIVVPAAAVCTMLIVAAYEPKSQDQLWEYRNLGKAFYENPDTHLQAVEQLRSALQLAPNSVQELTNYALSLLRAGQTEAGVAELVGVQKQDPALPHTWFNLGIAYKHAGDYDKAAEQFRGMLRLVPEDPVSHYNLASVLKAKGDLPGAIREFLEAEKRNPDLAGPHFQLFSSYQRVGDKESAAKERQMFEEAKKRNEGAAVPEDMEWNFYAELYDPPEPRPSAQTPPAQYDDQKISSGWDAATSGMEAIDIDGKGHTDLLVWSRDRVVLFNSGGNPVANSGLDTLRDVRDVAPGDFDNDGRMDLCVVTGGGAVLLHNNGGTFSKHSEFPTTAEASKAIWLDYDHDYDLDLFLFGPNPVLMRNNGHGKFEDHTAAFPFVKGKAIDAAVLALRGDTAARDLVVSYSDRPGVLYRDKLNEVFGTEDLPALAAGSSALNVQDFNRDGLLDLVVYKPEVYAIKNDGKTLTLAAKADVAKSPVRADFNGDRREDYARILPDGTVHIYTDSSPKQHWMSVRIEGVKNLKTAVDATVEVKSGPFYQKRIYDGVPLAFATDDHATADTVRITWPNGLIQNETQKKSGEALSIPEAQRLSGSCPMIFAWNGRKFEFITDVLGVAPLGASSGDGNYFPVDHDEYIQIPGSSLRAENGQYRVHITEELHEVSYLDKVQLIAVDHPSAVDIYTNDKFKSPPYPEFRLFGARSKIHPVLATEEGGHDVRPALSSRDQTYPVGFRHDSAGVADLHTLDLDFGNAAPGNRAALVLNGWVDWADGSTFMGASQDGKGGLTFPYLQVKDASGKWQTVVGDMGIPSGKPKTIVVDLTGKFLSRSREVRIVTNLCVYWDEIFLLDDAREPNTRLTPVDADSANLHFRGFSQAVIDPQRQQPEEFIYDQVRTRSSWNPTFGLYTRYGDVRSLVSRIDDRLLIMGSGDEVSLEFPAQNLPALPDGWSRDFLLLVDGWAKDADANTAFSQSVLPIPFHAMSAYPYKRDEHFPNDPDHQEYLREYLTRPALRLIRPLASGSDVSVKRAEYISAR